MCGNADAFENTISAIKKVLPSCTLVGPTCPPFHPNKPLIIEIKKKKPQILNSGMLGMQISCKPFQTLPF